jgi:thiosulfate sulfurtransferase
MTAIKEIDVQKVKEMADADSATIVDIRDPVSYKSGHIPNAVHLSDDNVKQFISDTNKENPLVVYCYHGISSQGAAAYFSEQGFKEVTSMIGGFESWQYTFPGLVIKA